jgi:hypothetical protein
MLSGYPFKGATTIKSAGKKGAKRSKKRVRKNRV